MKGLIIYRWITGNDFIHVIQTVINTEELCRDFEILIFTDKETDIQKQVEGLNFNYIDYSFTHLLKPIMESENLTFRKTHIENVINNIEAFYEGLYIPNRS
jgi:hypothetical protein